MTLVRRRFAIIAAAIFLPLIMVAIAAILAAGNAPPTTCPAATATPPAVPYTAPAPCAIPERP